MLHILREAIQAALYLPSCHQSEYYYDRSEQSDYQVLICPHTLPPPMYFRLPVRHQTSSNRYYTSFRPFWRQLPYRLTAINQTLTAPMSSQFPEATYDADALADECLIYAMSLTPQRENIRTVPSRRSAPDKCVH